MENASLVTASNNVEEGTEVDTPVTLNYSLDRQRKGVNSPIILSASMGKTTAHSSQRADVQRHRIGSTSVSSSSPNSSIELPSTGHHDELPLRRSAPQDAQLAVSLFDEDSGNEGHTRRTATSSYYTKEPKSGRPRFLSSLSCSQRLREYRHSSCLMTPVSALLLLAVLFLSLLSMIVTLPQLTLGILLGSLLKRGSWLVQFLYPLGIARWGHVAIMRWGNAASRDDGAAGKERRGAGDDPRKKLEKQGHSDTIYQRITVVPGRVFIHPIPQFLDNLAYLIVCCPPKPSLLGKGRLPIIGLLVDCGEAKKVLLYMECIYEHYYARDYPMTAEDVKCGSFGIELFAILCTHRHHDHTAGVGALVAHLKKKRNKANSGDVIFGKGVNAKTNIYETIPGRVIVVGGAVEKVPHCNLFAKNGCFIPLPCISQSDAFVNEIEDVAHRNCLVNDMNAIVSIEVIGVPSHTRGSVVYALRNCPAPEMSVPLISPMPHPLQSHLFTGDAIFSGGGGVPFEADLERPSDNFVKNSKSLKSKNGSSKFRPGAGTLSMERCFAEVLTRATGPWRPHATNISKQPKATPSLPPKTLLYPGHEYTTELLMRQFDQKHVPSDGHWTRAPPSVFFETASHYYISAHRRALPQGSKLLTVPTPLHREKVVNPHFRSLKRRGEHLVNAFQLWYDFGARDQIPKGDDDASGLTNGISTEQLARSGIGISSVGEGMNSSVFTTVYTADLERITIDLRSRMVHPSIAADRIESLHHRLAEKTIGRRPIPNTLPSHKNVYLGILALTVLGSAPSAVTVSDANIMDMAPPVDSTDKILISKRRLLTALYELGLLLNDSTKPRLDDIISLLWKEARLDNHPNPTKHESPNDSDAESFPNSDADDLIELGLLKLALFGVALKQPSWFSKFCLPCGSNKPKYARNSWVMTSKMQRTNGELVRHDAEECFLCRDVPAQCTHSQSNV